MGYALGAVKPWVKWAADQIGPKFGISTAGGYRAYADPNDHPNGHHDGLAVDFMVSDKSRGTALASYVRENAGHFGVVYVIWRQHIWSVARSGEGWRAMEDRGSTTANHYDHVHVSFSTSAPAAYKGNTTAPAKGSGTVVPVSTFSTKAKKPVNPDDDTDSSSTTENAGVLDSVIDLAGITDKIRTLSITGAFLFGGVALIIIGALAASAPARKQASDAALDVAQVIPETAAVATAVKSTQKAS